eukprot:CAMPEP_0170473028 /NCGR_PEP_ID=MMETSP0123-20130129/14981_1 /TAXON_ID=182087 /ORGANISM="Favella ehrenbergii, Strain Fehren 1" /LENGTH=127 /DNA_ID=CAMNT_0010741733 /DNA_START=744 /DNA_END=1127 /DNA_ORIENTATION=-
MQQQVASDGAAAQSNGSPEQQNMVEQEELQQQHMAQDIDGLQQQDDAEYGDEMGGTGQVQVSNALAEQRASKKRAQDDVKLLANRIALLKLEEKKVSDTSALPIHCSTSQLSILSLRALSTDAYTLR